MARSDYEAVIGLEVHVQLKTETKIFCNCPNRFGAQPNTLVCAVCLGYPGTLPVLNRAAVDQGIRLALALGATVHRRSIFARKNYFYADLPKGYQISQFDRPLAENGRLPLTQHDREVEIERLHLEEDAGKLLHEAPGGGQLPGTSLVDYNRCGTPLLEIVTTPSLRSAEEAQDYLQSLHQVLTTTGTSDGNMEEGSLRCDANVSMRPVGSAVLGTKAEVKNLNSFRFVARAIEYEIERQCALLDRGERVVQETRTFDSERGVTQPLRSKEEAHDYRYFPEPDLPPLVLAAARVDAIAAALPELPWTRRARLAADYGLDADDARLLTAEPALADYYEAAVAALPAQPQALANWVTNDVLKLRKEHGGAIGGAEDSASATVPAATLAQTVALVDDGTLSTSAGKTVFETLWQRRCADADAALDPAALAAELGLVQVRDADQIAAWAREAVAANPKQVAQYRGGKTKLIGFFVGQVMRASRGRAAPDLVQAALRDALDAAEV
ncbi:MAG: Asp-tRNA(Asn)/Glu-tRNA(Gln) amidotransferase subunit GatB [Acidobacteriota bacterium]